MIQTDVSQFNLMLTVIIINQVEHKFHIIIMLLSRHNLFNFQLVQVNYYYNYKYYYYYYYYYKFRF